MQRSWKQLSDTERAAVHQRFAANQIARRMNAEYQSATKISHRHLYAYARDIGVDSDGLIRRLLSEDPAVEREWLALLRALGGHSMTLAAAAADDDIVPMGYSSDRRWRYEVRQSAVVPYETVLIIKVLEGSTAPRRLQISRPGETVVDFPLDAPHRGVIQMFLDPESEESAILLDPMRRVIMW